MKSTALLAALAISVAMPAFAESPIAPDAGKKAEWREKWDKATPEERAKMKEAHHERMKEHHEKWEKATPEEREKMKAEKEARFKERYDKASPEEKKRMDEHKAKREEMKKKWDKATPEEREKLKKEWKEKHKGKHPHGFHADHGPGSGGAPAVKPQDAPKQ